MMTTLRARGSSKSLSEVWGEELLWPNLGVTLGQWPKAYQDLDYEFGMFVVLGPKGPISSGEFALPEYGFALRLGHGDVVLFDHKQLHCCCETWSSNSCLRLGAVTYLNSAVATSASHSSAPALLQAPLAARRRAKHGAVVEDHEGAEQVLNVTYSQAQ